ncbi:Histidine transport system permease protein HisM [Methylobacterium crusticola]|uniref:Histidine transport system permease protein HisM n=1 Tax=Methylobacterium crusticola TaxID=1697972 RepID=A0ABQ4QYP5_9HYPH|nr:amino acid ABC transporter permease [Methylobacterium crusticola]GJD49789.1 Histidine transport system permease protein HisM [Methylobacterium crusticola]
MMQWLQGPDGLTGLGLSILDDDLDRSAFLWGLWTTVWLSLVCIVLSFAIGIAGAWAQGASSRLGRGVVSAYIQVFRNTPPLVQLYFFFFAVGSLLPSVTDSYGQSVPMVTNVGWAVVSFSLYAGAFNIEIFRAGIEAVPSTTVEAAEALGYSRLGTYRHVVFPLALRISLPALGNNLVNLVKTTTLAYAIAVPELLYVSAQIWSEQLNVRTMMNLLLVVYIALVGLLVLGINRWERALRVPGLGR